MSLAAALSLGMGMAPFFCLALLTFGSLTRNLTEAIVSGVVVFLGGAGFTIVLADSLSAGGHQTFWAENSGLS